MTRRVGGCLGLGILVPHQVPSLHQSGQKKVTDGNKKRHEEPQGHVLSPSGWRVSRCPDTQGSPGRGTSVWFQAM